VLFYFKFNSSAVELFVSYTSGFSLTDAAMCMNLIVFVKHSDIVFYFFVIEILYCAKDLGPAILQILESDSCSDSGYNRRSNRNLPMFLPKKWPHRLLPPKWKSDAGSCFSQIFDSGSETKTQKPAGVDSGNPDPVPPLATRYRAGGKFMMYSTDSDSAINLNF